MLFRSECVTERTLVLVQIHQAIDLLFCDMALVADSFLQSTILCTVLYCRPQHKAFGSFYHKEEL